MKGRAMDEKFFEEILRRGFGDDTISNVTIKSQVPAVGKGENFLSQMWRFTLGYSRSDSCGTTREEETRLIVKCEPDVEGPGLQLIKDQTIFETEGKVFKEILPETERLLGRRLAPRCFHQEATAGSPGILVLEDLSILGFRTKDRLSGLSIAHTLMVLDNIADFHAASVYQYEQNPDLMKSFNEGILSEKTPQNMFRILEQTLQMIYEGIRDWSDPTYRKTSDKLLALKNSFAQELLHVTDHDDTEFCVLNHGDCWINNLMFREDERGNPLEVMLIDFQMSVYTSPVIDLVYFLSVCPAIEIKTDRDDFFYGKYLERLTKRMRLLGCKRQPPTIEELHKAIMKRRMWVVMAAITFYPRMIANSVETFDDLLESGETRMDVFENPTAKIALQKTLSYMEERGYLD